MILASFLQLGLHLPYKRDGYSSLEFVGRRVEIQYLDDLIRGEFVAHLADRADVFV